MIHNHVRRTRAKLKSVRLERLVYVSSSLFGYGLYESSVDVNMITPREIRNGVNAIVDQTLLLKDESGELYYEQLLNKVVITATYLIRTSVADLLGGFYESIEFDLARLSGNAYQRRLE
jgi:hypothetical protein